MSQYNYSQSELNHYFHKNEPWTGNNPYKAKGLQGANDDAIRVKKEFGLRPKSLMNVDKNVVSHQQNNLYLGDGKIKPEEMSLDDGFLVLNCSNPIFHQFSNQETNLHGIYEEVIDQHKEIKAERAMIDQQKNKSQLNLGSQPSSQVMTASLMMKKLNSSGLSKPITHSKAGKRGKGRNNRFNRSHYISQNKIKEEEREDDVEEDYFGDCDQSEETSMNHINNFASNLNPNSTGFSQLSIDKSSQFIKSNPTNINNNLSKIMNDLYTIPKKLSLINKIPEGAMKESVAFTEIERTGYYNSKCIFYFLNDFQKNLFVLLVSNFLIGKELKVGTIYHIYFEKCKTYSNPSIFICYALAE